MLLWSHYAAYDVSFGKFLTKEWGDKTGVKVRVRGHLSSARSLASATSSMGTSDRPRQKERRLARRPRRAW